MWSLKNAIICCPREWGIVSLEEERDEDENEKFTKRLFTSETDRVFFFNFGREIFLSNCRKYQFNCTRQLSFWWSRSSKCTSFGTTVWYHQKLWSLTNEQVLRWNFLEKGSKTNEFFLQRKLSKNEKRENENFVNGWGAKFTTVERDHEEISTLRG